VLAASSIVAASLALAACSTSGGSETALCEPISTTFVHQLPPQMPIRSEPIAVVMTRGGAVRTISIQQNQRIVVTSAQGPQPPLTCDSSVLAPGRTFNTSAGSAASFTAHGFGAVMVVGSIELPDNGGVEIPSPPRLIVFVLPPGPG
jgi:hypothetical protein